ncbi:MAG: phage tail protein, partial [Planctomycetota bacterium]
MARIIVAAAAAAVVGYFTGGTAALQTFALVYGATGFLDPNKKILGPKLQDLRAPQASYGSPIAYIEGAPRLAGNIIWASEKRPIANTSTQGSKGGAGVDSTNFTYESDVFYELAINECQALRRIWSNGKLIWSNADDATSETIAASASSTAWRDLRFYDGRADQMPDPTYEAAVGIGNAPAYRTRTTVMVEGLNLGGSGQYPVLTFEVLSEASTPFSVELLSTKEGRYPPAAGAPVWSLSAPYEVFVVGADLDTLSGFLYSFDVWSIDPLTGVQTHTFFADIGKHLYETMHGNTDLSVFIAKNALVGGSKWDVFNTEGFLVCTLNLDAQQFAVLQFSKIGNDLVTLGVGPATFIPLDNDSKLRRFHYDTGLQQAIAAVAFPTTCQSVAIGGAFVYSLSYDGLTLYKSDLATLALVDTIAIPAQYIATQGFVMCDGSTPYVIGAGTPNYTAPLIKWDGAAWTLQAYGSTNLPSPLLPPSAGMLDLYASTTTYSMMNFSGGVLFSQRETGSPSTMRVRYLDQRAAISLPRLDQVVRRLCLRTGLLTDADIDVTDLSHDVAIADGYVRAMAVTQVSSTRTTIETLMAAYLFECVEGGVLRFVRRGGAPALTVPYDDMGASGDGKAEPLPLKRLNDIEIAARVSVKYANTLNDFQDGLEAADRLVTESTAETVVEIPLGFQPGEAKKIADANTLDLAVALIQIGPVALSRKYAALEPTDVIVLTGIDGSTFRARIGKGTIGAGLYSLELALDDASVITSVASTDSDYVSSSLVRVLANTELQLLDIPILRDADDAPGFYAAFGADGVWSGAALDVSL